jgi:DNA repair exonuclease SbcCD ATPase subunit
MYTEFLELAKNEIDDIRQEIADIEKEEAKLQQQLQAILQKKQSLDIKDDALANYEAALAANAQICPVCFIREGNSVETQPVTPDGSNDAFRCSRCSTYIEVEV